MKTQDTMEWKGDAELERLALTIGDVGVLEWGVTGEEPSKRRSWREALRSLFRLRRHVMVAREVLDELFELERRTLITLILIETILLYILVPLLGDAVFVWYGLILTLSMWRYYVAYDYRAHPEHNLPLVWHQKFIVQNWLTALLFALLALYAMPRLDPYYQLFLFIVIMGVSAGTVKTLANDHRTAIGTLLILLLPLGVEMLLLMRRETFILAFLLLLYLATQVNILSRAYEQSVKLRRAHRILEEARELLYEKQELLQRFFEQAAEGFFTYDRDLRVLDCNAAFLSLFHFRREQVLGHRLTELPDEKLVTILRAALVDGVGSFRSFYRTSRGEQIWIEAKCSSLLNSEGRIIGGLGVIEDRTREQLSMEELHYLVSHDPLTSALNRRGFRQYMKDLMGKELHRTHPSLLLYLDMNSFKEFNDFYGHETGDGVLMEAARRFRKLLPDEGALVRLGGDEFALVIPFPEGLKRKRSETVDQWVGKVEDELSRPFRIQGHMLEVRCSIGVVVIEAGSTEVGPWIRAADIAMFRAKETKERYILYTPDMGEDHRQVLALREELEMALKRNQFVLHFQPIVEAESGRLLSAEVLIRWQHPRRGLLTPYHFLPVARQFHLISAIDTWVLEHVCEQIARWKEEGGMPLHSLSVNIDAHLMLREGFTEYLEALLQHYGIGEGELTLEITEDSLVDNFERARSVLARLREMGVACAIDDFGTGYSSLSYLKKLSFDILKIDREFVRDMLDRIENLFLLQTIISMGQKLNYRIVVEGIETERQREIVAGIDPVIACQGYLFARPLDEENFRRRFRAGGEDEI